MMNKVILRTLYILLFTVMAVGCGIPSFTIVNAPVLKTGSTVNVSFAAPTDDLNISGYEIYYKIYDANDSAQILADKEKFNESNPVYTYEFGSKKPASLGFKRLQFGDLSDTAIMPTPLISTEVSQQFNLQPGEVVDINFTTGNGYLSIAGSQEGVPLRAVKNSDGYFKPFSNNVVEEDGDSNKVTSSVAEYSISFVAFSYVSSIISTYQSSIPVFLGTLNRPNI